MSFYHDETKELVILTEHFAPSTGATAQLVTDLADDLSQMGVRLQVITSTQGSHSYPYPVHRTSRSSRAVIGILAKAIDGASFFFSSALWLLLNINQNHSLLIISNPPFIGLIGVILSIFKRTPYVFLFQDIFPRSASLTGILPSQGPLVSFWKLLLKSVLHKSETTIVLSSSMLRRCRQEFGTSVRLACIANWSVLPPHCTPKGKIALSHLWNVADTFTVQYSGNFGRLHDILTILEAARLLKDHPIKFLFVGGGAKATQITQYCTTYSLSNVLIKPYQARAILKDSLASCDVSIVSLIPGAEDTVAPSKIYGILASSKPILLISSSNSELAHEILEHNCGSSIIQGDVNGLASTILHLKDNPNLVLQMGLNSLRLYQRKYGRKQSTLSYYRILRHYGML